jgi:hypothetical protein
VRCVNQPIEEDEILCFYAGELLTQKQYDKANDEAAKTGLSYICELGNYVVDAKNAGNWSRLMNHSHDPNCELRKIVGKDGHQEVVVAAKRNIHVGEEVTIWYGPIFDKLIRKCLCKSIHCPQHPTFSQSPPQPKNVQHSEQFDELNNRLHAILCEAYNAGHSWSTFQIPTPSGGRRVANAMVRLSETLESMIELPLISNKLRKYYESWRRRIPDGFVVKDNWWHYHTLAC